jgi:hypothetical protein
MQIRLRSLLKISAAQIILNLIKLRSVKPIRILNFFYSCLIKKKNDSPYSLRQRRRFFIFNFEDMLVGGYSFYSTILDFDLNEHQIVLYEV